jgi:hypothetical protein
VRRFVFTADHGFLLLDEADLRLKQPHGQKTTPDRRHVLSTVAVDHPGELRVPFQELRYGSEPYQLMFPETVKVFDRGNKPMSFVHGGNSLQERLIPVLTVVHRSPTGGDTSRLTLSVEALKPLMGRHCIRIVVDREQKTLGFAGTDTVDLTVKVVDSRGHRVLIHDTRGATSESGGVVRVKVGSPVEVFFTLSGPDATRLQVRIEPLVRSTPVEPVTTRERFTVTPNSAPKTAEDMQPRANTGDGWLENLPEGGVRDVFRHLAQHKSITEAELTTLLGNPRKARRFGRDFEQYRALVPFDVHVETAASGKRYVRV